MNATFSAPTSSVAWTLTCTGTDGTYSATRAVYTGTAASSEPTLNGPLTLNTQSLVNTTTGLGTVSGDFAITATGGRVAGSLSSVISSGAVAGLMEARSSHDGPGLVANFSANYDAAARSDVLHAAEHASFFFTGLLVWTAMLDSAPRRRLSLGRRLAVAGSLFAAGQVLADVLLFTSPLYPMYASAQHASAVSDQQAAAIVMMGEQTLTLGLFGALALLRAFRTPVARQSGGATGNPAVDSTLPSAMMVIAS